MFEEIELSQTHIAGYQEDREAPLLQKHRETFGPIFEFEDSALQVKLFRVIQEKEVQKVRIFEFGGICGKTDKLCVVRLAKVFALEREDVDWSLDSVGTDLVCGEIVLE